MRSLQNVAPTAIGADQDGDPAQFKAKLWKGFVVLDVDLANHVRLSISRDSAFIVWRRFGRPSKSPSTRRLGDLDLPGELLKIGFDGLAPDVVAFAAQVQVVRHDFA